MVREILVQTEFPVTGKLELWNFNDYSLSCRLKIHKCITRVRRELRGSRSRDRISKVYSILPPYVSVSSIPAGVPREIAFIIHPPCHPPAVWGFDWHTNAKRARTRSDLWAEIFKILSTWKFQLAACYKSSFFAFEPPRGIRIRGRNPFSLSYTATLSRDREAVRSAKVYIPTLTREISRREFSKMLR